MPYIPKEQREHLDPELSTLIDRISLYDDDERPGAVNYVLTRIVHAAFLDAGKDDKYPPHYRSYAEAVAALECAKLELYRVFVVPYEDDKRQQNGSITFWTRD
jgi:hypothetical protein